MMQVGEAVQIFRPSADQPEQKWPSYLQVRQVSSHANTLATLYSGVFVDSNDRQVATFTVSMCSKETFTAPDNNALCPTKDFKSAECGSSV